MSQAIGLRSIASDLGMPFKLTIKTDATAAMGMCRRLGVGKVRHLDTALLWVQQQVRSGDVSLEKVTGQEDPADAMTKYLSRPDLKAHLGRMELSLEEGRAASAPQLTTAMTAGTHGVKEVMRLERVAFLSSLQQQAQGPSAAAPMDRL